MTKRQITVGQLFATLFISRIITNITYSSTISSSNSIWDQIISSGIAFILTFFMIIPVYLICNKRESMNIADMSYFLIGKIGVIFVFIYAAYYIFICVYSLSLFNNFVTNVMDPNISIILMSVSVLITTSYAAFKGIEALVRASGFILFLVILAGIFIIISLLPQIDSLNYEPLMYDGNQDVVKGVILMLSTTSCIPAMAMLIPLAKGKVKKGIVLWNVATYASISIFIFAIVGALGDYVKTQLFPVYTASMIAGIGFLKNLDSLYLGIWTTGLFIKISLFLLLFSMCIKRIFGDLAGRISIFVGAVFIVVISVLSNNTPYFNSYIYNVNFLFGFTLLTSIIMPLILLIVDFIKSRRRKESEKVKL